MSTSSTSNSSCLSLDHHHQQQLQIPPASASAPVVIPPLLAPSVPPLPPPPPAEQLCYVHCNLCDTVLAVSVPCTSLFKTVTVRCGHCTNLLPVNMRALLLPSPNHHHHHHHQLNFAHNLFINPPPLPPHTPTPLPHNLLLDEIPNLGQNFPMAAAAAAAAAANCFAASGRGGLVPNEIPIRNNPVHTRPPEKRQRVPSAYNRFIKDEIQRIKAGNPDISHREAFSAAAKNWAHFPHIHFGPMPDQTLKKTTIRPQEGEDALMKDGFFAASANVGVSPY